MDPKTNSQSHTEKRANYETTEAEGGKLALVEARMGREGGGGGVMQHDSSRNYNLLEVMCPGPQA